MREESLAQALDLFNTSSPVTLATLQEIAEQLTTVVPVHTYEVIDEEDFFGPKKRAIYGNIIDIKNLQSPVALIHVQNGLDFLPLTKSDLGPSCKTSIAGDLDYAIRRVK